MSHPTTTRPNWALAVIVIGVLITAVDSTIVVLALPTMMRTLHTSLTSAVWIVMGYLLTMTLLATQVGRLGDVFGRVRMYTAGFVVFLAGSSVCGISTAWLGLVLSRIVQGIGGGLIGANSGAVIADVFSPQQRGRTYGDNAIGWNLAAIVGILLGGFLTTYFSWRWIFFINLPIGAVALGLAGHAFHADIPRRSHQFDVWGLVTLASGVSCWLLATTRLASQGWSDTIALLGGLGAVGLLVFARVESRQREPLLRLSLFRVRTPTFSLLAAFLQGLGGFAVLFLIIMYLQGVRNLTPFDTSLLLVPGYLVGALAAPVAGRLAGRLGPATPATVDLGAGGFFPANNMAVMLATPTGEYGIASGMLRTFANPGMVLSFALALIMASTRIPRGLAYAIFVGSRHLPAYALARFPGRTAHCVLSLHRGPRARGHRLRGAYSTGGDGSRESQRGHRMLSRRPAFGSAIGTMGIWQTMPLERGLG